MKIEVRQLFRPNGLIDDVVFYGTREDYMQFSEAVQFAASSEKPAVLDTGCPICIEVEKDNEFEELFTSLQNEKNQYLSMHDWNARNLLRVIGSESILGELYLFLRELSAQGKGYCYISEFSTSSNYSCLSPEWRLHVENTNNRRDQVLRFDSKRQDLIP